MLNRKIFHKIFWLIKKVLGSTPLKFSEETQELKRRLLVLSVICIFIGLAKSLPNNIEIIGLKLESNPTIFGWVFFGVAFYFVLKFSISATLEIITHLLPIIVQYRTGNTTGSVLGFSLDDCYQQLEETAVPNDDRDEIGNVYGEMNDIKMQNAQIEKRWKRFREYSVNANTYLSDFMFPMLLWLWGAYSLYMFLKHGK